MDQNSRILYADLLPLDTSDGEVRELFSLFGKVRHVNIPTFYHEHPLNKGHPKPRCKGYAFIEYYTTDDAQKACDFFNDLDTILLSTQKEPKNEDSGKSTTNIIDEETRSKLLDNPRYVAMIPLRVMLKSVYHDLVRQYKEQKFQSLMRVAKTLAIV